MMTLFAGTTEPQEAEQAAAPLWVNVKLFAVAVATTPQ
jgi:hypothetical protein